MLCTLFTRVTEATDDGLKFLLSLMVKLCCLEVSSCCSSVTKYVVQTKSYTHSLAGYSCMQTSSTSDPS